MAINVTANWHLIRAMDPLLKRSDAGRAVFITSGAATSPAPIGRRIRFRKRRSTCWCAPTRKKRVRPRAGQSVQSRPYAHAHARAGHAGRRPVTLPTPEEVAAKIVDLCLPGFTETGKLYDFPAGKIIGIHAAGVKRRQSLETHSASRSRRNCRWIMPSDAAAGPPGGDYDSTCQRRMHLAPIIASRPCLLRRAAAGAAGEDRCTSGSAAMTPSPPSSDEFIGAACRPTSRRSASSSAFSNDSKIAHPPALGRSCLQVHRRAVRSIPAAT